MIPQGLHSELTGNKERHQHQLNSILLRGHEMIFGENSTSFSSGKLAFLIIVVTEIIFVLTWRSQVQWKTSIQGRNPNL